MRPSDQVLEEAARAEERAREAAAASEAEEAAHRDGELWLAQARDLWERLGELRSYADEIARVEGERAKFALRERVSKIAGDVVTTLALAACVAVGALIAFVALIVASTGWFEGRAWLGPMIVGLVALAAAATALAVRGKRKKLTDLKERIEDHERRRAEHRARFGHHVTDREETAGERAGAPGAGSGDRPGGGAPVHR